MTNQENKRRSFRCTDDEWKLIEKNAEQAHMTINQYLITKGTEQTTPLILTPDEQMRMRKTIRLLGIEAFDRYTKKGYTPEDIDAIMEGK